ncbi:polyubiquitin 11, partial [Tanacetum coccineum]
LGDSSNSRSAESTLKDRDLTSRAVLFVTCLTDSKTLEDHGDDTCIFTMFTSSKHIVTREHNVQHDPPKLVEVIKVTTGDFNHPVSFHEDDLPKGALQILIRIEFLSTMSFMCLRRDRIGILKVKIFLPRSCKSSSLLEFLFFLPTKAGICWTRASGQPHPCLLLRRQNGSILRRLNNSRMRGIFQIIYVIIASTGKLMHLRADRLCTINEVKVVIQDHEGIPAQLQTLFLPQ